MLHAIKFSLFLNLILLLEKEAKEGESRCYAHAQKYSIFGILKISDFYDIAFYFVKEIY